MCPVVSRWSCGNSYRTSILPIEVSKRTGEWSLLSQHEKYEMKSYSRHTLSLFIDLGIKQLPSITKHRAVYTKKSGCRVAKWHIASQPVLKPTTSLLACSPFFFPQSNPHDNNKHLMICVVHPSQPNVSSRRTLHSHNLRPIHGLPSIIEKKNVKIVGFFERYD
jgi:hypothetical protein